MRSHFECTDRATTGIPAEDVGLAVIRHIHERLMIDEAWAVRRPRGFSWLGHRLAQSVDASPMFESRQLDVWSITCRTIVASEVRADDTKVERLLAELNRGAIASTFHFDAETRQVELLLAQLVHHETAASRAEQLDALAIMQLCEAERIADSIAGMVSGAVARVGHPANGLRDVPDEMLNVVRDMVLPAGRDSSRYAVEAEMQAVTEHVSSSAYASLGATAEAVCIEVCFGEQLTSLIEIRSDLPHRWLGNGLSVTTWVPKFAGLDVHRLATSLSRDQFFTTLGGPALGGWGVRRREHDGELYTAWNRFLPNWLYQPQLILDTAIGEINRALWVDSLLFPELPPRNALRLLANRGMKQRGTDAASWH